jgi:DNA-binding transcriptional LysR family regulator
MKIENMRMLIEVSHWRSINKAARHLYINQQQLSHTIARCEEEVGTALFNRSNRGISLTPEGERIIRQMQEIVDLYDEILPGKNKHQEPHGNLQVMSEINQWTSYARFYENFILQYPGINMRVCNMATESIVEAVKNREGVGLITRVIQDGKADVDIDPELTFEPMGRDFVFAYGCGSNPLCEKYKSLSLSTLKDLPLINFKPYLNHPSLTERIFSNTGRPNIRYEVSDLRVLDRLLLSSNCLIVAFHRPSYNGARFDAAIHEIPLRDHVVLESGVLIHRQADETAQLFYKAYVDFYKKLYEEAGM